MIPPLYRRIKVIWLAALCLVPAIRIQADQFDDLRLDWQSKLVNNGASPASVANAANADWNSMNLGWSRTELWNDLPLGSVSANFVSTYDRLQAMALAWATPGCSLQGNASLASAVANGLDWMNTHVYTTNAVEYNNWFHWEISGPQALNNTAVLLYPALTGGEITNYLNAIDRFSPGGPGATYGWMTGANTSDKVLVMVIRGILGKDASKLTTARNNLSPVFQYVTSGDGFYTDGSFVFHSHIAYNGHYGLVLLGDIPQLVNLLQGSAWQITDPSLANIYGWISHSFEPLIYHGAMMDMVRGRAISWSYETETGDGNSVLSAVRQIAQFAPPATATALLNWANSPQLPPGQFQFPGMDRVVARRNDFTFGLSLSSSRIANYESINGGNLHGWFTGDGMTYLYLGDQETQFGGDFWPTVDPYHLPGTTVEINARADAAGEAKTTSQPWAGGAQVADTYGVAGMSLAAWNTTLTGKKSWFMFDNEIACLGAGINCGGPAEVDTTVEDRRLGTSPTNNFWINGVKIAHPIGWSSNLTRTTWCALDGVGGYYFPGGATNLEAAFATGTGSWSQINNIDSTATHADNYLKLWFNSGLKPTNATYAYVLLPNFTANSVSNYALNPDLIVLTNTAEVQAVRKPTLGVIAANFWTDGNHSADWITVNRKASVIAWEKTDSLTVGLSDPTQTNTGSIRLTLDRAASRLAAADPGVTVMQLSPQIVLSINVKGSSGKTFQAVFNDSNAVLPAITAIQPDGANLFQSTNTLTFEVTAAAGITTNHIAATLNGVKIDGLEFSGSTNDWHVSYPHLLPDETYSLTITVADANGNVSTASNAFDTFSAADYSWEAEDFDFNGGQFLDAPQTNAYAGLSARVDTDTHQTNFGGTDLYRPNGMDTEINGDTVRAPYQGTGHADYSLSYFSAGSWANYTRRYPAGAYHVYARLAAGGGATVCTLSRMGSRVGGFGVAVPVTNLLGTFSVPDTGWESYHDLPLQDAAGRLATVTFNGATNTLRLGRPDEAAADCNANFLLLVPVFTLTAAQNGTNLWYSFPAQTGFKYQVQSKKNLADANWLPLGDPVWGNDSNVIQSTIGLTNGSHGFYRVLVE